MRSHPTAGQARSAGSSAGDCRQRPVRVTRQTKPRAALDRRQLCNRDPRHQRACRNPPRCADWPSPSLSPAAPPVVGGQDAGDGPHLKPDTSMAEAQALLESGRPLDSERLLEKAVVRRPLAVPELHGPLVRAGGAVLARAGARAAGDGRNVVRLREGGVRRRPAGSRLDPVRRAAPSGRQRRSADRRNERSRHARRGFLEADPPTARAQARGDSARARQRRRRITRGCAIE